MFGSVCDALAQDVYLAHNTYLNWRALTAPLGVRKIQRRVDQLHGAALYVQGVRAMHFANLNREMAACKSEFDALACSGGATATQCSATAHTNTIQIDPACHHVIHVTDTATGTEQVQ